MSGLAQMRDFNGWTREFGCRSDVGRARQLNEDSLLILTPPTLTGELDAVMAIADGVGGNPAGAEASQMAVRLLDWWFTSGTYRAQTAYSPLHRDYLLVVLKETIEVLNERLRYLAGRGNGTTGMATTLTITLVQGDRLFVGHVGDSRAYLLREDRLQQLTQDHTWVAEQVLAGRLTPAEAEQHPRRNVLTRALGQSAVLRADRAAYELHPGDIVMVCSDGLSSMVPPDLIYRTLSTGPTIQLACDQLVMLANRQGGLDNISVIAMRVNQGGQSAYQAPGRVLGLEASAPSLDPMTAVTQRIPVRQTATLRTPSRRSGRLRWWMIGCLLALAAGGLALAAGLMLIDWPTWWVFLSRLFAELGSLVPGKLRP